MKRVLITGAAGMIGRLIRGPLEDCFEIRATDRTAGPGIVEADLEDLEATRRVMRGVDTVVHLAAASWEYDVHKVMLPANVVAVCNLFEAARLESVARVIFASSFHVVGCHFPEREGLGENAVVRPDTFYAVTKVFGEGLGRLYAEKHGLSVICLRIGYFLDEGRIDEGLNRDKRAVGLSRGDFTRMVVRSIEAKDLKFEIFNTTSICSPAWLDLSKARQVLGYEPQDRVVDLFEE